MGIVYKFANRKAPDEYSVLTLHFFQYPEHYCKFVIAPRTYCIFIRYRLSVQNYYFFQNCNKIYSIINIEILNIDNNNKNA